MLEPMIGLCAKLGDGMVLEKRRVDMARVRFVGDSPRAVLTKLDDTPMFRIWPGTPGTIKAIRLVHVQKNMEAPAQAARLVGVPK